MTKGERDAVHSLKNDNTLIIKEADKESTVVAWDKEDYLKEAKNQLDDKMIINNLKEMWKVLFRK